jgi:GNAT superfamily N-acetyltransferase
LVKIQAVAEIDIHWKIRRLDEGDEPDSRFAECLLSIEGRIQIAEKVVGIVDAFYLFAEKPVSDAAFIELWDLEAECCDVFEEIIDPDGARFRDPISKFLDPASGILCVRYIALQPPFRHMGVGQQVLRKLVWAMADPRIGVVLLDATPLQHRAHAYDDFDEEVRDLPWNSPLEDQQALMRHFASWGLQSVPGTRFVIASPESLRDARSPQWPPCPIIDQWNSCVVCGGWIDLDGHEWLDTPDGPIHLDCE